MQITPWLWNCGRKGAQNMCVQLSHARNCVPLACDIFIHTVFHYYSYNSLGSFLGTHMNVS